MYDYSNYRHMPSELKAQDAELHQKQLDALDRYDFAEALVLSQEQTALWENWNKQYAQEKESAGATDEGGHPRMMTDSEQEKQFKS
jgi:hypothetical protein